MCELRYSPSLPPSNDPNREALFAMARAAQAALAECTAEPPLGTNEEACTEMGGVGAEDPQAVQTRLAFLRRQLSSLDPQRAGDVRMKIVETLWRDAAGQLCLCLRQRHVDCRLDAGLAIGELKTLIMTQPDYPEADKAIFLLARMLLARDLHKEGASYMLRLSKDYPHSPYAHAALRAVADFYFQNNLLMAAWVFYERLPPDPEVMLLLGFVHLNLRNDDEARTAFTWVIEHCPKGR